MSLSGPCVLVVDDDQDTRELVEAFLHPTGARVNTARDGFEALVAAHALRPDIIFCDIVMPGLDGYAVMHMLRHDPRLSAIPVVAITALGTNSDVVDTTLAGFVGHLVKPLTPEMIVSQVQRLTSFTSL